MYGHFEAGNLVAVDDHRSRFSVKGDRQPLVFLRYGEKAVSHYPNPRGLPPGIYEDWSLAVVSHAGVNYVMDLDEYSMNCVSDKLVQQKIDDVNMRLCQKGRWRPAPVFLRELPNTMYWERDLVVRQDVDGCGNHRLLSCRIHSVDYLRLDGVRPYGLNVVAGVERAGECAARSADAQELQLVNRGLVWKYHHGEPMHFSSVRQMMRFYYFVGATRQLYNPHFPSKYQWGGMTVYNGVSLDWTEEQAIAAMENGRAHGFVVLPRDEGYNNGTYLSAILFRNPELGEEVADMFLRKKGRQRKEEKTHVMARYWVAT